MDFYAVLGLSRSASAAEVERAYKRLSRRYHPGINPGDRVAEDLYRQIQDAYAVLTDAERRRQYDQGARGSQDRETVVAFEGFDFSALADGARAATFSELFADVFQDAAREATAPAQGSDLEMTIRVPFMAAVRGADVPLSITRQVRCHVCLGGGAVATAPRICPSCGGEGTRRWTRGHMVFTKPCEACAASGRLTADGCRVCRAAGTVARTEVVTVTVPPGIESGARIAGPGRGHAGARGGRGGDLYVTVEVAPHPVFERRGRDLLVRLPIAVHEAALGARVDVPTLGDPVRVRVPPGTSSGRRIRVRGQGLRLPGEAEPGDLIVDVQIVLPAAIDEASQELLREFGRRNAADVRRHLWTDDQMGA
jgi:molecular chaperone DnaJ